MTGRHILVIEEMLQRFVITLDRKYTIIRGDSGIGKSHLASLVELAILDERAVKMSCDVPVRRLVGADWKSVIDSHSEPVVWIADENDICLLDEGKFATAVKKANAYFVLITRSKFAGLPYSIKSIYTLVTEEAGVTSLNQPFYSTKAVPVYCDKNDDIMPECIITEDEKAGRQFYDKSLTCDAIPSGGKSKVWKECKVSFRNHKIASAVAIVDGAAFGADIDKALDTLRGINDQGGSYILLAPESFEWLVLKAMGYSEVDLDKLWETCDSIRYDSFEQYCTALLEGWAKSKGMRYDKGKLQNWVLEFKDGLLDQLPEIPRSLRK